MDGAILEGPLGQVLQQMKGLQATQAVLRVENSELFDQLQACGKIEVGLRANNAWLAMEVEAGKEMAMESSQLKTQLSEMHSECARLSAEVKFLHEEDEKHRHELACCNAENSAWVERLEASSRNEAGLRAKNTALIGKLEVSERKEFRLETQLSETRAECDVLRADVIALREKDEVHRDELACGKTHSHGMKRRFEKPSRDSKDAVDARADLLSKLEAKEVVVQLVDARLKKAKRKSNASEHVTKHSTQTRPIKDDDADAGARESAEEARCKTKVEWPGFGVLEQKGDKYYRDMYDGAAYNDNGAALRSFVASLRPSRQVAVDMRSHIWGVSGIYDSHPESPPAESEDTPAITTANSPSDEVVRNPATPQAEREPVVQCTKLSFEIPRPLIAKQPDRSQQCMPASPLQGGKAPTRLAASLIDCSIPSAFRDERRKSRGQLRPTSPAPSSRSSSEQAESVNRSHQACQSGVQESRGCKRLRWADVTGDEQSEQASRSRRNVCVHCWATEGRCDANENARCKTCMKAGVECVRMRCGFGLACRHAKCVYLHPGQWDESDDAWIVRNGRMPLRGGKWPSDQVHVR